MIRDISKMTALVWNMGEFSYVAERLATGFGKVILYCPRESNFPTHKRDMMGEGLKNVEKVIDFWPYVEDADIIVFPFIGEGKLQQQLRKMGKSVFGTGNGEMLERDREFFKKVLGKVGLPTIPHKMVYGWDELREKMKKEKDFWIKISDHRGIGETYHHRDYDSSEEWLFSIGHFLGPKRKDYPFMCEESIKAKEVGHDVFCVDGKYYPYCLYGMEQKDQCYVCKVVKHEDLPEIILNIDKRMAPVYKKMGVRSAISTEVRKTKDGTAYYNDATQRMGSPPGEIITTIYKNLPEIYAAVANGEIIEPKFEAWYAASIFMYSHSLTKDFIAVDFPEKISGRVKLQNYYISEKGQHYCIPEPADEGDVVGAVVGMGSSLKKACDEALELAKQVKADGIYFFENSFDAAMEELAEARKEGIGFS